MLFFGTLASWMIFLFFIWKNWVGTQKILFYARWDLDEDPVSEMFREAEKLPKGKKVFVTLMLFGR
jgi:hypothetical protein